MWLALAHCFEKLGRRFNAIACLEQSANLSQDSTLTFEKIATLYHEIGRREQAAEMYYKFLKKIIMEQNYDGSDLAMDYHKLESKKFTAANFLYSFWLEKRHFDQCEEVLQIIQDTEEGQKLMKELKRITTHTSQ